MKSLKGSETEKCLMKAFAGESQARNRYTMFAAKANREGYVQISDIFSETADQEREHAKRFFKFLEGGDLEITASFPAGIVDSTAKNLKGSAAGENFEWTELYPSFAKTAKEEGYDEVTAAFEAICVAEKQHEKRYNGLLANVESGAVFKKSNKVVWRCRNCGYLHKGDEAPEACPACVHPRAHFELLGENW